MLEEGGWSRGGRGWRSCTCKARESVKEGRTDCEKPEQKGLERRLRERKREHKKRAERLSKGEERAVEKRKKRL